MQNVISLEDKSSERPSDSKLSLVFETAKITEKNQPRKRNSCGTKNRNYLTARDGEKFQRILMECEGRRLEITNL
jgi:hypothetical protein